MDSDLDLGLDAHIRLAVRRALFGWIERGRHEVAEGRLGRARSVGPIRRVHRQGRRGRQLRQRDRLVRIGVRSSGRCLGGDDGRRPHDDPEQDRGDGRGAGPSMTARTVTLGCLPTGASRDHGPDRALKRVSGHLHGPHGPLRDPRNLRAGPGATLGRDGPPRHRPPRLPRRAGGRGRRAGAAGERLGGRPASPGDRWTDRPRRPRPASTTVAAAAGAPRGPGPGRLDLHSRR